MKCPKCGSGELRRDAEAIWDAKKGAWVMNDEDWKMGSFIWCAECSAEFDPPAPVERFDDDTKQKPVAWLHIMHMEGGQTDRRLSFTQANVFGRPDKDYSAEYKVTSEPLYLVPPTPESRPCDGKDGGEKR